MPGGGARVGRRVWDLWGSRYRADALHLPRFSLEGLELQVNECETQERENHTETL